MTTPKKSTNTRIGLKKVDKNYSPVALKAKIEYLERALAEKDVLIMEKDEQIVELTEERDVLRRQLAKVSALGDQERERVVNKLLKEHPDCFQELEYDDAYEEAIKKTSV